MMFDVVSFLNQYIHSQACQMYIVHGVAATRKECDNLSLKPNSKHDPELKASTLLQFFFSSKSITCRTAVCVCALYSRKMYGNIGRGWSFFFLFFNSYLVSQHLANLLLQPKKD